MNTRVFGGINILLTALGLWTGGAHTAAAQVSHCSCNPPDICEPPTAEVDLQFGRVFPGPYRTGEPYDILTINPAGKGDTLEQMQITLRVRLYCEWSGLALVGVPAEEVILYSQALCMCRGWKPAAAPTDPNGWTSFSGSLRAGGCAPNLQLFVSGIFVATVPIKTNSPDHLPASPCAVDASDLSAFAARIGKPVRYSVCSDYNEDGAVDASDLSSFASTLGSHCP